MAKDHIGIPVPDVDIACAGDGGAAFELRHVIDVLAHNTGRARDQSARAP
jgi:hypothetical protein